MKPKENATMALDPVLLRRSQHMVGFVRDLGQVDRGTDSEARQRMHEHSMEDTERDMGHESFSQRMDTILITGWGESS